MQKQNRSNGISSPAAWRSARAAQEMARAEHLRLPSGATILAVRPEPLEWILSGRIPQRLLGAAIEASSSGTAGSNHEMTREEILELAAFARQLVKASVIKPAIGDAPGEMALDDIPVEDRAYIFEWACRALGGSASGETAKVSRKLGVESRNGKNATPNSLLSTPSSKNDETEDHSSRPLERFRAK